MESRSKWGGAALLLATAAQAANERGAPAAAVNVFIGTGGDGHTFPGATRPFGMVQLSVAGAGKVRMRKAEDGVVLIAVAGRPRIALAEMAHPGVGADLGDVLLMPHSGETKLEPDYPERAFSG